MVEWIIQCRKNYTLRQGGITCEAIDEPRKSSYAIDERVIINFRDKNVVIARFRDKNEVFVLFIIKPAREARGPEGPARWER